MEHRLTTIVAADIVGYSRLVSDDEERVITRFRALRDEVIGPRIKSVGGRIIKMMGDGMLAEFSSPEIALNCALDVQLNIAQREAEISNSHRLLFRIGINYGKVIVDENDVLGDVVNIAARLESLASPGGICLSQAARELITDPLAPALAPLGPQFVKNIPEPVEVWHVLIEGVPAPVTFQVERSARPSIAVLAFENNSADSEQEFLADGIVEDVVTQLSRFRSLFVIARNSTSFYKGTRKDITQIGNELGVRYVVSGNVRRSGDRLRVSAKLTETATGAQLWSNKWDRTMSDLFAVQDELTRAIVSQVVPELGANEKNLARRKPTKNLNAWELCQRGISEFSSYTAEGYLAALDYYRRAAEADPNYALPRALIARWHTVRVVTGRSDNIPFDLQQAFENATKAVHMDDRLEDGHVVLGTVFGMMQRPDEAFLALDRAQALNDNNAAMYYARMPRCTMLAHMCVCFSLKSIRPA